MTRANPKLNRDTCKISVDSWNGMLYIYNIKL
jgi:hypothetical protein